MLLFLLPDCFFSAGQDLIYKAIILIIDWLMIDLVVFSVLFSALSFFFQ